MQCIVSRMVVPGHPSIIGCLGEGGGVSRCLWDGKFDVCPTDAGASAFHSGWSGSRRCWRGKRGKRRLFFDEDHGPVHAFAFSIAWR